jgi:hypothetical protein
MSATTTDRWVLCVEVRDTGADCQVLAGPFDTAGDAETALADYTPDSGLAYHVLTVDEARTIGADHTGELD